jgi:hypothetical protein
MNHTSKAMRVTRPGHWQLATLVPESTRIDCLPRHFGRHCVSVEQSIFNWMRRLASSYQGGFWQFYTLPNDGFYMAPDDEPFDIVCEGNGFEGRVSADASGIIASLMAYSHLSFQIRDEKIVAAFHKLLACVHRHPEAASILRALD